MVGITLSPEQIRSAPPEVREWLEHEITASLGLGLIAEHAGSSPQLAICSQREAEAIFAKVSGMFAVANVFFELGRESAEMTQGGLEAFRLSDMLRHTRLAGMQQLLACLQLVDRTFKELRGDNDAALFALDRRGYCLVPVETRRNILSVWTRLITPQEEAQGEGADTAKPAFAQPFATSGIVPPASIHMDGVFPGASVSELPSVANEPTQQ